MKESSVLKISDLWIFCISFSAKPFCTLTFLGNLVVSCMFSVYREFGVNVLTLLSNLVLNCISSLYRKFGVNLLTPFCHFKAPHNNKRV
jgi:hypothetical protein